MWHPWQHAVPPTRYGGFPFYTPKPTVSIKGSVLGLIPELEHQLLYCQRVSVPFEPGRRKQ